MSMATPTSVSKMILSEEFTGSNDLESCLSHFEPQAQLHNMKCTLSGTERGEPPHFFALRLNKSAI